MRRVGAKLRGIRFLVTYEVPGYFNDGALEPETNAEERHSLFAGILDRRYLAPDAPAAEASRHQNTVGFLKDTRDFVFGHAVHLNGVYPVDVDPGSIGQPSVA